MNLSKTMVPGWLLVAAVGLLGAPAQATSTQALETGEAQAEAVRTKKKTKRKTTRKSGDKAGGDNEATGEDAGGAPERKRETKRLHGDKNKPADLPAAVSQSELGFAVREMTPAELKKAKRKVGLMVTAVESGGLAEEMGLKQGDIITSTGGVSAELPRHAFEPIIDAMKGDQINIAVVRAGKDVIVEFVAPEDEKEREEREAKEEQAKEEEEQRQKEEEEQRQRDEEEERQRELEEEKERAQEAEEDAKELEHERDLEKIETKAEAEDKFTLLNCVVCSICLPGLAPVWVILWLLVDGDTPDVTPHDPNMPPRGRDPDENRVEIVRY